MSEYRPDSWVIVEITFNKESHYRVFAGWYGGYLNGDSWKMNSGITAIREVGDMYEFDGESGSTYFCHKIAERMSGYMMDVLTSLKKGESDTMKIKVVDYKDMKL